MASGFGWLYNRLCLLRFHEQLDAPRSWDSNWQFWRRGKGQKSILVDFQIPNHKNLSLSIITISTTSLTPHLLERAQIVTLSHHQFIPNNSQRHTALPSKRLNRIKSTFRASDAALKGTSHSTFPHTALKAVNMHATQPRNERHGMSSSTYDSILLASSTLEPTAAASRGPSRGRNHSLADNV